MINRFIFNQLRDEISYPEIVILLGPRQVGKTTLLKQLEEYVKSIHKPTSFFDLEQPQTLAEFNWPLWQDTGNSKDLKSKGIHLVLGKRRQWSFLKQGSKDSVSFFTYSNLYHVIK